MKRIYTKKIKGYPVAQGACCDGEYDYLIFEKKTPHRCKIVKMRDGKAVKVSRALKIGHGNDVCYHDGKLYITHSAGKKVIHVVDAKSLEKKKDIKVDGEYNGIARCNNGFLLREMGGSRIVIMNNKFKRKGTIKSKGVYTSQGMCFRGKSFFRSFSDLQSKNKNIVIEYDLKGNKIREKSLKIKGELECVFFHGDKMRAVFYVKKKGAHIYEVGTWAK